MFYPVDDLRDETICLRLDHTCDAQPEKHWLPAYYFHICLPDGTKVGQCDLRIGYNEKTAVGGNIGYAIDEMYRGHHYAGRGVTCNTDPSLLGSSYSRSNRICLMTRHACT